MIDISVMPGVVSVLGLKKPFGPVEYREGMTVADLMNDLGIRSALVLVNGVMTNQRRPLRDGDLVRFMVAMGGG